MTVGGMSFGADLFQRLFISRTGLYIVAGIAALVAVFFLIFILVGLWERQHLTGDVEHAGEPYPYPPSAYWTATRQDALQLGWQPAGDFATRKDTTVVRGLQSLFLSPDRLTIAAVISSSFAGAKLKKTVLRSKLTSGRVLESTDNPGVDDLSGVIERTMLWNAGMAELMELHARRLQSANSPALAFNPNAALEEFEQIDLNRGARWVMLGLAYWVNPQQTCIRMTVRGALRLAGNLFKGSNSVSGQEHRGRIRRAGSRPQDRAMRT
jgi:hypothetical protein